MGKSKSQNIQKTKETKDKETKANKPEYVQPEQINITMYTLVTMIVTLVNTAFAIVTMVLNGRPVYYFLEGMVGDSLNFYSYEMAELLLYEIVDEGKVNGLFLGMAAFGIITAIVSIVGLVRAMNPETKPMVLPYVISLVSAIAVIPLYFYTDDFLYENLLKVVVVNEPRVGLYDFVLITAIVNIVAVIAGIVAALSGLKRWKETGRTNK